MLSLNVQESRDVLCCWKMSRQSPVQGDGIVDGEELGTIDLSELRVWKGVFRSPQALMSSTSKTRNHHQGFQDRLGCHPAEDVKAQQR